MDVDNASNTEQPPGNPITNNDGHEIVVVSSVGLHVEGPIPYINPEIHAGYHLIVQLESNNVESNNEEVEGVSPSISVASSRVASPVELHDDNSHDGVNPEPKGDSRKRSLSEDEDDGRLCPICLDNWTNTGEHRICSLKCGHLFGYKCVTRWLNSQPKKSCPTCKKKVNKSDLRYIYAKKLIAVDATEVERLKTELDQAIEEKNKVLIDVSKYACREQMLIQENQSLKRQISELSNSRHDQRLQPGGVNDRHSSNPVSLYMDKSLDLCRQSGCRVFDIKLPQDMIMASMRAPNALFPGYGIRKINISQYKTLSFMHLHQLQIRDMAFHPMQDWILTASMDKSFKVVDTVSNSVTYTTTQQMPLWSCCWDAINQFYLYVGTQSGFVAKYDLRTMNEPVATLAVAGDMSPVVSVVSIPPMPGGDLGNGSIVSCKLNSLWMFENTTDGYLHQHPLTRLEGPFVSMKYQDDTKQLLVSSRPNNRIPYSRHTLCTLDKVDDTVSCNVSHCFQGGGMQKLLSKSCFVSHKQEYVAAHQESSRSVHLWSISTGQKVASVPAHDAVLDLKGVQTPNGNFLVSLTEKKMEFFKFL
nr:unnamed protein product [Callosobruchus chinensis]